VPYADPAKQRAYQLERYHKIRADWFEGKSCVHCASTAELEVHHVDPERKFDHKLWSWTPERRAAELEKCEVLCRPCHQRLHGERRRSPCGTAARYRAGCRCSACRVAHGVYNRAWRERKRAEAA
jgi:hypothetical protein